MIAERLIHPGSKLATTRSWHRTTLAASYGVDDADEDELYAPMDWLLQRQGTIENNLAAPPRCACGGALQRLLELT